MTTKAERLSLARFMPGIAFKLADAAVKAGNLDEAKSLLPAMLASDRSIIEKRIAERQK